MHDGDRIVSESGHMDLSLDSDVSSVTKEIISHLWASFSLFMTLVAVKAEWDNVYVHVL